ncbi:MAG: peptide deformylase [Bacteroidales bacterium]|nr:peptide deformylase [Bacteroidales bacterium]
MIYPIYLYGSKVLREKAQAVDIANEKKEELQQLLQDMFDTMKKADGCGLAAPQIGISKRILVVDGNDFAEVYPELAGFNRMMINPEFTFKSEETSEYNEGCLSIPHLDADIVRPKKVTIKYLDRDLNEIEETFDDFAARMIQHEMDHLDGMMFIDRAAPIRKKILSGKLNSIAKGSVRTAYKVKLEK